MNKKAVMVIPADEHCYEPLVYPPLGLLYIAAIFEKHGIETSVFDLRDTNNKIEKIPQADYFCFTATCSQIKQAEEAAQFLKKNRSGIKTFIGGSFVGPHIPYDYKNFDVVVIGPGEGAIDKILKTPEEDWAQFYEGNLLQLDIDDIPFPARHLMPKENIVSDKLWEGYGFGKGPISTTIITSRGCPWKCAFCANIPQKVKYRSVENIVREIEEIKKIYGCTNFRFIDDNFIMNKKRLKKLCPALEKLNIQFRCSGRSDLVDEKTCKLLKQAGCCEIGFGVETADDNILKLLKKGETVKDHKKAIKIAKKSGLKTKVFMMSGLPEETWETIEKNKKFIEETAPDKFINTLFTPYPGCEIFNKPQKFFIDILDKEMVNYYQVYPARSVIKTNKASREELGLHFEEMISFLRKFQKE